MPGTARNNLGLLEGFSAGEDGWDSADKANLRRIDSLTQASVKDKDLNTPPGSPTDGDRYIVGPAPTGAWASKAGQIATWNSVSSAWDFYVAKKGWRTYVEDERLTYHYESAWGNDDVEYNAVRFGAKGDDSTDNATALQACADAVAAAGGGIIRLPKGVFRTSLPVKLAAHVSIVGAGRQATTLRGTAAGQDVVRLQGSNHLVARLQIRGTETSGAGVGIRHNGQDGVGAEIVVENVIIDSVDIFGTPSWGIELRGGTGQEIYETRIIDTTCRSAVTNGSLLYGEGASSPSLYCRGCNFSGPATGTYGADPLDRGGVHLDTVTQGTFVQCVFEPTNSPIISMLSCNNITFHGCKYTMFLGGASGKYMVTMAGFNFNILWDGCEFLQLATATGPRFLKTSTTGGSTAVTISNCNFDTNHTAFNATDDIILGSATDDVAVINSPVININSGAMRGLVIFNSATSFDRRRVTSGAISVPHGGYNRPHYLLGARHIFLDAIGNMRCRWFNDSTPTPEPTSATDGDLVAVDNAYVTLENTTSPSVSVLNGGRNFKCSPGSPTTITTFDDATNGQTIRIIFTNGNATISESGNIRLNGTGSFVGSADDVLVLTFDGTNWYEVSRSVN